MLFKIKSDKVSEKLEKDHEKLQNVYKNVERIRLEIVSKYKRWSSCKSDCRAKIYLI